MNEKDFQFTVFAAIHHQTCTAFWHGRALVFSIGRERVFPGRRKGA
jgi:hypothetical protein